MEWRVSILVSQIRIGAPVQQQLRHGWVSCFHRPEQRRVASSGTRIHICLGIQQKFHGIRSGRRFRDCGQERNKLRIGWRIHLGALGEQRGNGVRVLIGGGNEKQGSARGVRRVGISAGGQKRFQHLHILQGRKSERVGICCPGFFCVGISLELKQQFDHRGVALGHGNLKRSVRAVGRRSVEFIPGARLFQTLSCHR